VTVSDATPASPRIRPVAASDLERFIAAEYPAVVAAVGAITGDREGAADAVQDAIVRYLGQPPAEPVRNLAAWLTVVAANRSRDLARRRAVEQRAHARHGVAADVVNPPPMSADVMTALRSLPHRQRTVCVLHYLLDRSVADIAAELGITTGTVKTQLHRARAVLAMRLVAHAPVNGGTPAERVASPIRRSPVPQPVAG
jgi:RNA polymerase sigma-70 factor (ECF subfamily)